MEIWKEVKGYRDYEVSNLGRVKSLARTVTTARGCWSYKEKFLKNCLSSNGYLVTSLSKNTKSKTKYIHQLVAEAFLNHTPNGFKLVVDHQNGVRTDNRLENLQVITTRKNTSKGFKNCSSEYTGVCWVKRDKKWKASIQINGKIKHLGVFTDETKAAEAYQIALNSL